MYFRNAIILFAGYIIVCIPAQCSWVVCVRADGTTHFTSADHCCASCSDCTHKHCEAKCEVEIVANASSLIPHYHCCDDYPVPVLPQLAVEKGCETSVQDYSQASLPSAVLDNTALGNVLIGAFDCLTQAPSHISTFILLI